MIAGLGSLLVDYPAQTAVTKADFMHQLRMYARQHTHGRATNGTSPWIGEVMHPDTGEWLARYLMYGRTTGGELRDRGIWYNHSVFLDLILAGLFGFRTLGPLSFSVAPQAVGLDYFAVDNLRWRGRNLCLRFDATGARYKGAAGLAVLLDGNVIASAPTLQRLVVTLP
jgi:hypothetical protein